MSNESSLTPLEFFTRIQSAGDPERPARSAVLEIYTVADIKYFIRGFVEYCDTAHLGTGGMIEENVLLQNVACVVPEIVRGMHDEPEEREIATLNIMTPWVLAYAELTGESV